MGLALLGLAAGQGLGGLSECLSEHRDARDGRLLFLRNENAQVTREQFTRRAPASLPVFSCDATRKRPRVAVGQATGLVETPRIVLYRDLRRLDAGN